MCLAIPGRITSFEDENRHYAIVEVSGVRRKVNVELLREDGLENGDWVLIHVGFAMSKISEQEAKEQIDLLTMLGEAGEAQQEIEGYTFGGNAGEGGVEEKQ